MMRAALLVLAAAAPVLAQAPPPALPRLEADAMLHDFGRVPAGRKVSHAFLLRNTGNAVLEIRKVESTCGCTVGQMARSTLQPGDSAPLEVHLNTEGLRGEVQKSLTVLSNDPAAPALTLIIKAEVHPVLEVSSEDVVFQEVGGRDRRKATVRVRSLTAERPAVTAMDLSEAPWLGVATRSEGMDLFVDFELLGKRLPPGRESGTDLVILHMENPEPTLVHLRVHWEKRLPVTAVPARVAWAGAAGREYRTRVVLSHAAGKPFRVLSATPSNPLIRVGPLPAKASPRQVLQLSLSPEAAPGALRETVNLSLEGAGGRHLVLPVAIQLEGGGTGEAGPGQRP